VNAQHLSLGTMTKSVRHAELFALTSLSVLIAFALSNEARAADDTMEAWRNYAGASMTPEFDWADQPKAEAPDLLGRALAPESTLLSVRLSGAESLPVAIQFSSSVSGDSPDRNSSFGALRDVEVPQAGLVRNVLSADVSREVGNDSRVLAGIVLASQQFASFGLGTEVIEHQGQAGRDLTETASGTGVRVGFERDLNERLSVGTMVQSKVNMEAFQSYRGVFSDPGDFDLPARASVTARWQPFAFADLSVSAQRIFYSDLVAFSSRSLPTRFLALLNDGSQPELTWRDLNVYSADIGVSMGDASRMTLRYSTQQQPEPSSIVLFNAFSELLTDNNFALGFEHRFDRVGQLRLAASYAPSEYYLGNISALSGNRSTGSQVEAEAVWRVDF
jgi:hypothetical protein